jgi:hypothetical protein
VINFVKRILGISQPKSANSASTIGTQVPGELFVFANTATLRAVDPIVIALPKLLLGDSPIAASVHVDNDAEISIPADGSLFFVRLKPGMQISLKTSCQAMLVSDDKAPKQIAVIRHGPNQSLTGST